MRTIEFVSKELAIKLKEKGFFEACFGSYYIKNPIGEVRDLILNRSAHTGQTYQSILKWHVETREKYATVNIALAPTIEQVLKWLREEKDIMVFPVYSKNTSRWYCEIVNADSLESEKLLFPDSYEDACIAGIEYAINNLI